MSAGAAAALESARGLLAVSEAAVAAVADATRATEPGFADLPRIEHVLHDTAARLATAAVAATEDGLTARSDVGAAAAATAATAATLKSALFRQLEALRRHAKASEARGEASDATGTRAAERDVTAALPPLAQAVDALSARVVALSGKLRAESDARFYCPPPAYWDALGLLRRQGGAAVLLHGAPGSGKAALARALLHAHIRVRHERRAPARLCSQREPRHPL